MFQVKKRWADAEAVDLIKTGGLVVMPTDTIYGIVASALNREAVEKLYKVKRRPPEKPFIILVSDLEQVKYFDINLNNQQIEAITKLVDQPTSFILDCQNSKFEYLHRGTQTLAFRVPSIVELQEFLIATGPLIAPSANTSGEPAARDVNEAKKYFSENVDLYIDHGVLDTKPSRIIRLFQDGSQHIIRQ